MPTRRLLCLLPLSLALVACAAPEADDDGSTSVEQASCYGDTSEVRAATTYSDVKLPSGTKARSFSVKFTLDADAKSFGLTAEGNGKKISVVLREVYDFRKDSPTDQTGYEWVLSIIRGQWAYAERLVTVEPGQTYELAIGLKDGKVIGSLNGVTVKDDFNPTFFDGKVTLSATSKRMESAWTEGVTCRGSDAGTIAFTRLKTDGKLLSVRPADVTARTEAPYAPIVGICRPNGRCVSPLPKYADGTFFHPLTR